MSLSNRCDFTKTASEKQSKIMREIWQTKSDAVLKKTASDFKYDAVLHEPDAVHGTASEKRSMK